MEAQLKRARTSAIDKDALLVSDANASDRLPMPAINQRRSTCARRHGGRRNSHPERTGLPQQKTRMNDLFHGAGCGQLTNVSWLALGIRRHTRALTENAIAILGRRFHPLLSEIAFFLTRPLVPKMSRLGWNGVVKGEVDMAKWNSSYSNEVS